MLKVSIQSTLSNLNSLLSGGRKNVRITKCCHDRDSNYRGFYCLKIFKRPEKVVRISISSK